MQELYLKTIYLTRNILKMEKLKYFIYKNNQFSEKFLILINNILTLESNHNQSLEGENFSKAFAKAFVLITNSKEKQRFETFDNKTEDEMLIDIDLIIKQIVKEFKVAKTKLVDQSEQITSSEIQKLSILTEQNINKWDQKLQEESKQDEEIKVEDQKQNTGAEQENVNTQQQTNLINQQDMNNIFNMFNSNMIENLQNKELPVMPLQDPRFYPYNSKPKFMPIFKMVLSILSIISTLLVISTLVFLSLTNIDISSDDYAKTFGVNSWTDFMDSNIAKFLNSIPLGGLKVNNIRGVLLALMHVVPAILICSYTFKSNQNNKEKYRMKLMPVVLFLIMFGMILGTLFSFISSKNIEATWKNDLVQQLIQKNQDQFKNNFNKFWQLVIQNYGSKINIATILSAICLSITIFTLIVALILLVVNPKIDKERIIKANIEHQKAVMAIMNGESYEIDPLLYDNEEIEIKEPNKFQLFIMKMKNKKSNKSKKDE